MQIHRRFIDLPPSVPQIAQKGFRPEKGLRIAPKGRRFGSPPKGRPVGSPPKGLRALDVRGRLRLADPGPTITKDLLGAPDHFARSGWDSA